MPVRRIHFLLSFSVLTTAGAADALPQAATRQVDFTKEIRPLLEKHYIKCHGPEKEKADLRLDSKAHAMKGATDGAVILPGKSAESRLVLAVAGVDEDLVMPPKGARRVRQ